MSASPRVWTVRRQRRANGDEVYRIALRGVRIAAGADVFYFREDAEHECDIRNRREGRIRMASDA